jgi:transposase
MEKRTRRKFSKEFKAETVALIRQSGKSIAEICRDMGLPESSVHRWCERRRKNGPGVGIKAGQ